MECNINYNEKKNNLYMNQKPIDRPDLTTKVFNLKLNELKKKLYFK